MVKFLRKEHYGMIVNLRKYLFIFYIVFVCVHLENELILHRAWFGCHIKPHIHVFTLTIIVLKLLKTYQTVFRNEPPLYCYPFLSYLHYFFLIDIFNIIFGLKLNKESKNLYSISNDII